MRPARENGMNVTMWILAGAAVGWAAMALLKLNTNRSMLASVVIGMVAGFLGGFLLSPMLGGSAVDAGNFNPFSLFMAFASAACCLIAGDMIHKRFGL